MIKAIYFERCQLLGQNIFTDNKTEIVATRDEEREEETNMLSLEDDEN